MNSEPTFVDTWGWMALGHRGDTRHPEVAGLFHSLRSQRTPLYTTDYVLDELITLLYRRETFAEATRFVQTVLSAEGTGRFAIVPVTEERFAVAWQLRQRFDDKPSISFTDLTSIAVMQEFRIAQVLSDDDHFRQVGLGFHLAPGSER